MAFDWRDCIASDPNVCHGKVCVKGTRILVSVILAALAEGMNPAEVAEEYPPLTEEQVRAAIAYAAELTDEEDMTPLRSATLA